MIATNSEKRIIEILVKKFKDKDFLESIIGILETEEQRTKLLKWLGNTSDYSKTDVHEAIINIIF